MTELLTNKNKEVGNCDYIGGIPATIFTPESMGKTIEVMGYSGQEYVCLVTQRSVCIKPSDDTDNTALYEFYLGINQITQGLNARIRTISDEGVRSPDLYAKQLLRASVAHFKTKGKPFNHWLAQWYPGCTNFIQWKDNIRYGNQAPFYTWTGQRALELGYNCVLYIGKFYDEDDIKKDPNNYTEEFKFISLEEFNKLPTYIRMNQKAIEYKHIY